MSEHLRRAAVAAGVALALACGASSPSLGQHTGKSTTHIVPGGRRPDLMPAERVLATAKIPVRRATPSSIVSLLQGQSGGGGEPGQPPRRAMPAGIDQIIPYDPERFILAQGTERALAELRELVTLMDVPARSLRLQVRLTRSAPRAPGGKLVERVVGEPTILTGNDTSATVILVDRDTQVRVLIRPRLMPGRQASVYTALSLSERKVVPGQDDKAADHVGPLRELRSVEGTRRIPLGRRSTVLFLGTDGAPYQLDSQPAAVWPQRSRVPGYYLDLAVSAGPSDTP